MKRTIVAATTAALGLSVALTVPSQAAPAQGTAGVAHAVAAKSRLRWHACADTRLAGYGIKCATVRVPLNYKRPRGARISIEISRKLHTSSAKHYQGVMLVNPGGPGGSGLSLPVLSSYVPNGVGGDYDWIGFDPRGVGQSRPVLHCNTSYFTADRPSYVPSTAKLLSFWKTKTTRYARACANSKARRLLGHLTTRDNARDMDSIRKALGVRRINYYGFSWGSYLGQVYLTMFPSHVRRVVLDGIVDPTRVWYGANLDQDRAFDKNMDVFWAWVAKYDSVFHLGTSGSAIKQKYYAELAKLKTQPAAGGKLGPDEMTDAMLDAGYYIYNWQSDAQMFADLVNNNDGTAMYAAYHDGTMGAANENGYAVYDGVQCGDNPWPGWSRTLRDSARYYKFAPFETWSNTWYNAPCINWPVKAQHRTKVRSSAKIGKFLLMSETKDAATPYSGALEVRRLFPQARLIAGVGGTTHASSLSGVPCVDDTIARYLATGKVPARVSGNRADLRCPKLAPPVPKAGAGRTEARNGLPEIVREALLAAQRYIG